MMMMKDELTLAWCLVLRLQGHVTISLNSEHLLPTSCPFKLSLPIPLLVDTTSISLSWEVNRHIA